METKSTHVLGSIYDTKAEIFSQPQLYRSKADLIRACQGAAKDPQTMLHKHPSDYQIFVVGAWSESDAIVANSLEYLGTVLDLCPLS
ncbi:nonstructural protein [Apis mellifera associated microvirus 28]|nr:nonstructural protein [Apis mellifera associated microvirus 28]